MAPRLTLDIGLRYDIERLPAGFNEQTHDFSPRLGLAWSPSSKWVLRGGYGIFFDRYVLAGLRRAAEKNGSQAFEQVADGLAAVNLFAAASGGGLTAPSSGIAPSIFRADPRLATPYSQQASAGAEYLVAPNLTIAANYLFVRGVHLSRTVNVNLLQPVLLTAGNAASLGIPNPTPQQIGREVFSPGRQNPQFNDVYQIEDSASSTYNGFSVPSTGARPMNSHFPPAIHCQKRWMTLRTSMNSRRIHLIWGPSARCLYRISGICLCSTRCGICRLETMRMGGRSSAGHPAGPSAFPAH